MPDDHSKLVPLLPIPNRTVKRLCANDSADPRVKVGHRQAPIPAQQRPALIQCGALLLGETTFINGVPLLGYLRDSDGQCCAVHEDLQLVVSKGRPGLIACQRRCDDDCHPIGWCRVLREVDTQVFIRQMRLCKRMPAFRVAKICGCMGPEGLAIGEQEIEGAMGCDDSRQFPQRARQFFDAGNGRMGFRQLLHDPAKGVFAVR